MPVVEQFDPTWVLISAGFDAHTDDFLANFNLTADDYGWMTTQLAGIHPAHRTILALEGGYDLRALHDSTLAAVRGLTGEFESDLEPLESPISATSALREAAHSIGRYWAV